MRQRSLLFCAASAVLLSLVACGGYDRSPGGTIPPGPPLPRTIIDLSPTTTEDLPVRMSGQKFLRDSGFRESTTFEHVVAEEPLYVIDSYLTIFNHAGPHVDAPNHLAKGAKSVDEISLDEVFGTARLLDRRAGARDEAVSLAEVQASGIRAGEIFILYAGYETPDGADELPTYPYLSREAAEFLADLPIKAFATDTASVDSFRRFYEALESGATGYEALAPIHYVFLTREIPVIEQLVNLQSLVDEAQFVFVGFPLKVEDGNGGPMRAAALLY